MKKLLQGRTRQNRDGKIFESIDSSFIPNTYSTKKFFKEVEEQKNLQGSN